MKIIFYYLKICDFNYAISRICLFYFFIKLKFLNKITYECNSKIIIYYK